MKKFIFGIGLIFLISLFISNLIYTEEQQTQGEFITIFVKSLGLEYRLPEKATIDDYVALLKEEGFTLPEGFSPEKIITKEEKANLLSQIINRQTISEGEYLSKTEQYRNRAIIEKIQGEVFIKPEGKTDWIPAKINMELTQGDTIKTNPGAVVLLRVGVAGRVVIKENSELNLRELTTQVDKKSESILMYLAMGEIDVDVRYIDRKSIFETHTPTTVAAVRGTIYTVKVLIDGKTEIR